MSGALWQKIKRDGKKFGLDPRLATELGRLSWFAEFTTAQVAAGFRVAEIYGRYEYYHGKRRNCRSPSYERAYGDGSFDHGDAEREEAANRAFANLQTVLNRLMPPRVVSAPAADHCTHPERAHEVLSIVPPALRNALEELCVENRPVSSAFYDELRRVLDRLAVEFGITSARGGGRSSAAASSFNKTIRSLRQAKELAAQSGSHKPNMDRSAWIDVVRKLRPDLSEMELSNAYDFMIALRDRARLRAGNGAAFKKS